ncbi:MAG: hypothetical protein AAGG57_17760 [Pseudomonadota bacterium]
MIVIGGALLGAIIGAMTARRRKGNTLDMLQYGAGYGLAFSVLGMIATVVLDRMV